MKPPSLRPTVLYRAFLHAIFCWGCLAPILCLTPMGFTAGSVAIQSPQGAVTPPHNAAATTQHTDTPTTMTECLPVEPAPPELAKQPNYRQVVVLAQGQNDQALPRLTAKDLRLYQANRQLQIAFFKPQPATVGILVDTSTRMWRKLPICRAAIKSFMDDLDPSDKIFLLSFSDHVLVLAKPTTDHARIIKSLHRLHALGRTALYDSVIQALQTFSSSCTKTKAIVLLTDGMDNASSSTLKDTVDLARKTSVPIYSIGIGNTNWADLKTQMMLSTGTGSMSDDRVDGRALNDLSENTGGKIFIVNLIRRSETVKQATAAIANKIGNQYVVGFIGDGSTAQLRIEAPMDKGLALRIAE